MPLTRELLQQIDLVNRRHGLIQKKDSLIIGLSGGPDSTALLALLVKWRRKFTLNIFAAHLNHGLSQKEGHRFFLAARKSAQRFKVPFYSKKILLRSVAVRHKRSIEDMGRVERYAFFCELAKKLRANKIVTAHTLDDQAETLLMRIVRGAGLRGLEGISFKRNEGRYLVVRPLLGCRKADLLNYLKEEKIPYCVDPSNKSGAFTRNRVRHRLLPLIECDFNPRIKEALSNLQASSSLIQNFLDGHSLQAYKDCSKGAGRGRRSVCLRLERLKKLHPALIAEVVFRAIGECKGDVKNFTSEHISAILDVVRSAENHLSLHLPDAVAVKKRVPYLEFRCADTRDKRASNQVYSKAEQVR